MPLRNRNCSSRYACQRRRRSAAATLALHGVSVETEADCRPAIASSRHAPFVGAPKWSPSGSDVQVQPRCERIPSGNSYDDVRRFLKNL